MKALVKVKPGKGFTLMDMPEPVIERPNEVIIKVKYASICGTDVHIYQWDEWSEKRIKPPRIIGHELCGEVVEVGKEVKSVKIGDIVSAETHIVCGDCYQCKIGNMHICDNVKILGVDIDGVFAEYVKIPALNAWKVSSNIPIEVVSLFEPFGNAVHSTLIDEIVGKDVAVFGCGPIGLMSIGVAKVSGAKRVFAVEVSDYRLDFAKMMGADFLINPLEEDPVELILDKTDGHGVDVFLEMSGNPKAIIQGIKATKKGGRVSLLGIPKDKVVFEDFAEDIVFKYLKIYGINGRLMFKTWYQANALLESGKVNLKPLITHKFKLEEYDKAMQLLINKKAIKILFEINP